jgi:hypothetical protein
VITYAFSSKEEGSGALFGGPRDMMNVVVCGCGGGGGVAWVDENDYRDLTCTLRFMI